MYQQVMLGETNTKKFKDVTFKEGFALVVIIAVYSLGCIQNQLQTFTQVWKIF
jgi:hypothetical protein